MVITATGADTAVIGAGTASADAGTGGTAFGTLTAIGSDVVFVIASNAIAAAIGRKHEDMK
jgi:uncharacterized membrane protein